MHQPVGVYPGSFDPIHVGHMAIVERATQIFSKVVVGILENSGKDPLFSPTERADMMRELYAGNPAVEVRRFSGLLVSFLKELDAKIIIRGMRAVSDFEYEFQMALMNRRLYPSAETVFLTPKEEYLYLSSKLVREVVALGGDVTGLVPEPVRVRLEARYRSSKGRPAAD
ncbi:MAG: pantetheine-phosphate adenylyltransferase [bacterium]|nr:pantetheine-phosphate adenylyltransferase [bacterium]